MKNIYLALLLVGVAGIVIAQNCSNKSAINNDAISVNGLTLGIEKEKFIKGFGQPDSIVEMINEYSDTKFNAFHYKASEFYFEEGRFTSFMIRDKFFKVNGVSIGDNRTTIQGRNSSAYVEKEDSGDQNIVKIPIAGTESYLIYTFEDEILIKIERWTYE